MSFSKSKNFGSFSPKTLKIGRAIAFIVCMVIFIIGCACKNSYVHVPGAGPTPEWNVALKKLWPIHLGN